MAFSCGDGYAHRWARHLMMMMNSFADFSANQICAASPIKGAMNNNSKTFTSFNHVINNNI